jgi:hypothetical protein
MQGERPYRRHFNPTAKNVEIDLQMTEIFGANGNKKEVFFLCGLISHH